MVGTSDERAIDEGTRWNAVGFNRVQWDIIGVSMLQIYLDPCQRPPMPSGVSQRLPLNALSGSYLQLQLALRSLWRDIDALSARTHQPSFPRQPYILTAPRPAWALGTTPDSTPLHTNSSRQLHFWGRHASGPFELLTCELTEAHPRNMAQRPLRPWSVHQPQV
eukprot:COSAG02_NODE_619_length_19446_cov_9.557141_21_plen_164_part_00